MSISSTTDFSKKDIGNTSSNQKQVSSSTIRQNNNTNKEPNQNQQNNNNNVPAFNNPFHLDPAHEDIQIERRLDQNMFCPLVSLSENFGEQNDYYSMRTIEPLKESFFWVRLMFLSFYELI